MLGWGLPSQGSLVDVERSVIISFEGGRELLDLVVGHPGSFAKEEANLVELNWHIPHASKSENMKASTSFMVSSSDWNCLVHRFSHFSLTDHLFRANKDCLSKWLLIIQFCHQDNIDKQVQSSIWSSV